MAGSARTTRWLDGVGARVLVALLAVDLVFLAVHATHVRYGVPADGIWSIARDRGVPEWWQYLKLAAVVVVLVDLVRSRPGPLYAVWAAIFAYFLVDDALEVHERAGEWLGDWLDLAPRGDLDPRDIGQVLFAGVIGLVVLGALAVAYRLDGSRARRLTVHLVVALFALGFCGVVADTIDVIDVFGLVEDGGEMVVISVMLALVVHHRVTGAVAVEAEADRSVVTGA